MLRTELDDYSAASFSSFSKYYFGTPDEIRALIQAMDENKRDEDGHKSLLAAFRAYESGQTDVTHNVAYQEVLFLLPAKLLHTEKVALNDYA